MIAAALPFALNAGRINDVLSRFGLGANLGLPRFDQLLAGSPLGLLKELSDGFEQVGGGAAQTAAFQALPPFAFLPPPAAVLKRSLPIKGYATVHQNLDLAPGSRHDTFALLFDPKRRNAAQFERTLQSNPFLRASFERAVGGRVLFDGLNDGRITIERKLAIAMPLGANPLAKSAAGCIGAMDFAIQKQLGALAGLLKGPASYALGMTSGLAAVAHKPEANGKDEVAEMLKDPSLTVEDKVTMMIMLIMKRMDKEIEDQAQHVNEVQQAQNKKSSDSPAPGAGGKGGKGGLFGAIGGIAGGLLGPLSGVLGGGSSPLGGLLGGGATKAGDAGADGKKSDSSIDVETMKMKRMVDKRSQMFDMLKGIIDKYNETSKGIIQSMGR